MRALAALVVLLVAGCSAATAPRPAVLRAELVSPTDVVLRWAGRDPGAAGHVLEFATEPRGPYTILAFLPAEESGYTHPDLIPETTFHYRLRPYYGRASAEVDVTVDGGEQASSGDLRATATGPDSVAFTWTGRGADGSLLENRPAGRTGFRVVALVDPGVGTFDLVTLPEERQATYRVRAFRYGPPSNVVRLTTGGH